MRIFGLITMLVGLVIAFGYPSFHAGFSNFEIGKYTIFDQQNGYQAQSIWLAPDDMPIVISFDAIAEDGISNSGDQNALLLEIRDGDSIVFNGEVAFSALSGDQTGVASATYAAKIESLEIVNGALYAFNFGESGVDPRPFNNITMTVTGIVTEQNNTIPRTGYALVGLGALSYLIGGRRKAKRSGNAPSGTRSKASQIGRRADHVKTPKPDKEKHQWGRGADD